MGKTLVAAVLFWMSAAAVAGLNEAQIAFKKGDYAGAIKEYSSLGNAGDINAQLILGALYSKGEVVPHDDKLAASWFQKAANQGSSTAQFALGKLYEESKSLPQDYQQAATWYLKAAQQGSDSAQVRLGNFYSKGFGVPQNYNEAILWYGKAALKGNADAQHALGLCYTLGKGLPKNNELAIGWHAKAAAQGNADSQFLLGDAYKNGAGVSKDTVLAQALYNLAVNNNVSLKENATIQRDSLAKQLTPTQLEASKILTAELSKPDNFSKALKNHEEQSGQIFRFFDRPEK